MSLLGAKSHGGICPTVAEGSISVGDANIRRNFTELDETRKSPDSGDTGVVRAGLRADLSTTILCPPPRVPSSAGDFLSPAAVANDHPVWEVYDLLRTARLNEGYYAMKLARLKRRQRAIDITIAVAAPTSAVAAWNQDAAWIPEVVRPFVKPAWAGFAGLASLLAIANPFLRLSESLSNMEACMTEYRSIAAELEELRSEIKHRRVYDAQLQEWYRYVRQRRRRVSEHEPTDPVNTRLRRKIEKRIVQELPGAAFYVPPQEDQQHAQRAETGETAGAAAAAAQST